MKFGGYIRQDWIFGEMRYGRKLEAGYGVKVGRQVFIASLYRCIFYSRPRISIEIEKHARSVFSCT